MSGADKDKEGIPYWFGRLEQLMAEQSREIREIRVEQAAQKKTITDIGTVVARHEQTISRQSMEARQSHSDITREAGEFHAAVQTYIDGSVVPALASLRENDEKQNKQIAAIAAAALIQSSDMRKQTRSLAVMKFGGPVATALATAMVAALVKWLFGG